MDFNCHSEVYVDGNGDGVIRARWKLFREPDPDDPTRDIVYGCIEGPELAMYVRGTARLVNGRGNYEFDWRVEAVRREERGFQVYRPWDEVLPGGTDPAAV